MAIVYIFSGFLAASIIFTFFPTLGLTISNKLKEWKDKHFVSGDN